MIYTVVYESDFYDGLERVNAGFSYEGAGILYEFLQEWGDMEFDPIGIRTQFTEYGDAKEAAEDYLDPDIFEEILAEEPDPNEALFEMLQRDYTVLGSPDGPVIMSD